MVKSWEYETNLKRIKIVRRYRVLLARKHLSPKKAFRIINKEFGICRKSLYNYMRRFADMPLRNLE